MGNAIAAGQNVSFGCCKMLGDATSTEQNKSPFWDRISKSDVLMRNIFPFPQGSYSNRILEQTSEELDHPRENGSGVTQCNGVSSAWEMLMAQMVPVSSSHQAHP